MNQPAAARRFAPVRCTLREYFLLATALSAVACGGGDNPTGASTLAATGRGLLRLLVAADGSLVASVGFERNGDCSPLPETSPCGIEVEVPRLPECGGTDPMIANAGSIAITSGATTTTLVPDHFGFYMDTIIPGSDLTAPVHVSAEGAEVPAFEGDVTISSATFNLTSPLNGTSVSESGDLSVSWAAKGNAETATVRLIGQAPSGPLTVACAFPPTSSPGTIPSRLFTGMDPSKRTFVSLKPDNSVVVKASGWTTDIVTEGVFDFREVTLTP